MVVPTSVLYGPSGMHQNLGCLGLSHVFLALMHSFSLYSKKAIKPTRNNKTNV